ncbi:unnamed protein product [Prunus armeniaca]|uniref:Uncharacterized protein n=1 Tax=Prunus armeniaca TaxID=36596 RepID=A0A6J5UCA0_PRUAR|nr:unnamed protein product [Prunus armeniaca]
MGNYFPSNSFREPNEALVLKERQRTLVYVIQHDTCIYRWNSTVMLIWILGRSAVVQSRFSQMVLASVHMAFGSVLGHWDLGQSNVISCHLGKALSILFRSVKKHVFCL